MRKCVDMAKQISADDLMAIEQAVSLFPEGATAQQILRASAPPRIPLRTLQYHLKNLVVKKRLIKNGEGRWTRYTLPLPPAKSDLTPIAGSSDSEAFVISLSPAAMAIRDYIRQKPEARKPVGYDRSFLDVYRPNVSFYLSENERRHLADVGRPKFAEQPAGTYAKAILSRLLIDLAWNSSRLEGNTYSLLETKRLIELGVEAAGRAHREAQMILNHKDAIGFLVSAADEIGFNRYTILNLHALLANNLLTDAGAAGRLRIIAVGIEHSVFLPLAVPQLVEECFDQILAKAGAIIDPFEQAFFAMVQLPYLQPFDDVNKRVSRLAANISLIKGNLSPLSFADVPRQAYTEAVLGVYELNKIELLKDVFIWAYERSAARYAAVRQSLGEPDPFRFQYRDRLREVIADIVCSSLSREDAVARISASAHDMTSLVDRARFIEVAEAELTSLHEGNFARYQIRPSEFAIWWRKWQE
jgi:hypothetical protein